MHVDSDFRYKAPCECTHAFCDSVTVTVRAVLIHAECETVRAIVLDMLLETAVRLLDTAMGLFTEGQQAVPDALKEELLLEELCGLDRSVIQHQQLHLQ